jgi:hypothetical protein
MPPDPIPIKPVARRIPPRRSPLPPPQTGGGIIRTVVALGFTVEPLRSVPKNAKGQPMAAQTSIAPATLNGSVEGASFPVPAGTVTTQIDAVLNDPDIINPAGFILDLYLEVSYDGGLTFVAVYSVTWVSGPNSVLIGTTTPAPPGLAISGVFPDNAQFRARVNAPQSLYFGATVTYFDVNGNVL